MLSGLLPLHSMIMSSTAPLSSHHNRKILLHLILFLQRESYHKCKFGREHQDFVLAAHKDKIHKLVHNSTWCRGNLVFLLYCAFFIPFPIKVILNKQHGTSIPCVSCWLFILLLFSLLFCFVFLFLPGSLELHQTWLHPIFIGLKHSGEDHNGFITKLSWAA